MTAFLDHNKSLKFLDLLGNRNLFNIEASVDHDRKQIFNFALAIRKHPSLQTLVLRHCGVNDDSAREFFQTFRTYKDSQQQLPRLKHLDLTMSTFHAPLEWIRDMALGLQNLQEVGIPPTFAENTSTIHSRDEEICQALQKNMSLEFVFDAWRSGGQQHRRALMSNATGNPTSASSTSSTSPAKIGPKLHHLLRRNHLIAQVLPWIKFVSTAESGSKEKKGNHAKRQSRKAVCVPSDPNHCMSASLWPRLMETLGSNEEGLTPLYMFLRNQCSAVQM
eukprot:CAMPEP_0172449780 /NCGR_PEP_ID=MMETSP1065-20121228/8391_1 /TAXON_ID=265537 /ORGANISM="Amphiprora paludosa, Strain CCMP125" /LENGTH=276 /DNA_ID=CAMNT_0013201519 /DNA_START=48 /DNA_END=878 /DNA_ORIENTATION=+